MSEQRPQLDKLPAVEMKLIERQFQKPPWQILLFDVTLRNDNTEARWFILPENLTLRSKPTLGNGVFSVEVFELKGQGRAVISYLSGSFDFYALLLPAGAEVKLRRLPFDLWQSDPLEIGSDSIEVVIARQIIIGDEPDRSWFGTNPMSDVLADVSYDRSRALSLPSGLPDLKEFPLSFLEEHRLKVYLYSR